MAAQLSLTRMLWRAVRRRCPRCGAGGLFSSWFRLGEHCPGCGYRFAREEGFWLGAYLINFAVTEGLLGGLLFAYILVAAADPDTSMVPVVVAGVAAAVVGPLAFFPFSRTIWAAIDLAMRPLEPAEEAEAVLARTRPEGVNPPDGG